MEEVTRSVRRPQEEPPSWAEGNRFLVLYTTLMLILVTFFIMLVSRANFDEAKFGQTKQSLRDTFGVMPGGRSLIGSDTGLPFEGYGPETVDGNMILQNNELDKMRALLAPKIMDSDATIIHGRDGAKTVSLAADLVFEPDSAALLPEVEETLLALSRIMANSPAQIMVEGHTDDLPPQTEGVGDNWDISSARALAVLQFLTNEGGISPDRLSAFGYGGTKPLYPNTSPRNRARNNRIDLVIDFDPTKSTQLRGLEPKEQLLDYQGFEFLIENAVPSGGE